MDNIVIQLNPPKNSLDDYARTDANLIRVRVQLPSGEMVSTPDYKVEITLSRDGMIGLGTELLRAAYREKDQFFLRHLRPSDENLVSQILGVFMHPGSCELICTEADLGTSQEAVDSNTSS